MTVQEDLHIEPAVEPPMFDRPSTPSSVSCNPPQNAVQRPCYIAPEYGSPPDW